jgi:hypothetical protein
MEEESKLNISECLRMDLAEILKLTTVDVSIQLGDLLVDYVAALGRGDWDYLENNLGIVLALMPEEMRKDPRIFPNIRMVANTLSDYVMADDQGSIGEFYGVARGLRDRGMCYFDERVLD